MFYFIFFPSFTSSSFLSNASHLKFFGYMNHLFIPHYQSSIHRILDPHSNKRFIDLFVACFMLAHSLETKEEEICSLCKIANCTK